MEKLEIKKSKWFLFPTLSIGLLLSPLIIGLFIIGYGIARYKADKIEIADGQFFSRLGLFNIDIKTIPLSKISMVSVKTNLFTALLGYGTIEIQSSALNSTIEYPYIKNPVETVKEINKFLA